MGRRHMDSRPTMKITMESTPAIIGRRMKKLEKFIVLLFMVSPVLRRLRESPGGSAIRNFYIVSVRDFLLRRHGHPGTSALEPVDNDFVARLQAGTNDAPAFDDRTELHRPVFDGVGGSQSQHVFLGLVGANGAVGDEQDGM